MSDKFKTMKWYSPFSAPFVMEGLPFFEQDRIYRRLPVNLVHPLPNDVELLTTNTAGVQIRFKAYTKAIAIRIKLHGAHYMHHMAPVGEMGADLYLSKEGEPRFHSSTSFNEQKDYIESALLDLEHENTYNAVINLPLYQGVYEVQLGFDESTQLMPPEQRKRQGRAVFYGTSITQGGCANRPGMAYTNILSRKMDVECINLGFSGSGKGEPEVAHAIAMIENPRILVLDYDCNCPTAQQLEKTMYDFIKIYRESHNNVPILVVSKLRYAAELIDERSAADRIERRTAQVNALEKLAGEGYKDIYFQDGAELLGEDFEVCTVDGIHPTDLGFYRIAEVLLPVVENILDTH